MAFNEGAHQHSHDVRRKQKLAEHRKATGTDWLIRDDGALFPNVPTIAKKPNFRPYHGDPAATLEQRLQYLQGLMQQRRRVIMSEPMDEPEEFDLSKASKEELIAFALDEFEMVIKPDEHLNVVRSIVAELAGVDKVAAQRPNGPGAPVQRQRKAGAPAAAGLS